MRFFETVLSLALLAGSAAAQAASIMYPTPGSSLTAGSEFTVQIGVTDSLSNVDQVAIVFGLAPCNSNGCPAPTESIGNVLYQGGFNPITPGGGLFYQKFTVTAPEGLPAGNASLNVLQVFLIGDVYGPNINYVSETIMIV